MKHLWWPVIVVGILAGSAWLLLRTEQAPLPPVVAENPVAAVDPAAAVVEEESTPQITVEQFRSLGAEVMRSLPTRQSVKSLTAEETHGVPVPLFVAGERLGAIAEAVENNFSLAEEAILLYKGCASSGQYPDSVRALCYLNYRALVKKLGQPVARKLVPSHISDFAERLKN